MIAHRGRSIQHDERPLDQVSASAGGLEPDFPAETSDHVEAVFGSISLVSVSGRDEINQQS